MIALAFISFQYRTGRRTHVMFLVAGALNLAPVWLLVAVARNTGHFDATNAQNPIAFCLI